MGIIGIFHLRTLPLPRLDYPGLTDGWCSICSKIILLSWWRNLGSNPLTRGGGWKDTIRLWIDYWEGRWGKGSPAGLQKGSRPVDWCRPTRWSDEEVSVNICYLWLSPVANLHYRNASKKSGTAVEAFLKKMHHQMGVAMIGFAAYRNEEGKLCTFELDFSLPSVTHTKLTST